MENIDRIRQLVEFQTNYNRKRQINNKYREEEKKLEKLQADNAVLLSGKNDLDVTIAEMDRKIREEMGRREDIQKRITSLNDGKDKIKIARQVKSWEKEMERQQQELSLIQAQIDYDSQKTTELQSELGKVNGRIEENQKKASELESQINVIKDEHKDELSDIDSRLSTIREDFDVQFIEYFEALLVKTAGTAIVEIDDDACLGCFTILPTILQGELGPELKIEDVDLYQCPHCFRYLYYKDWFAAVS